MGDNKRPLLTSCLARDAGLNVLKKTRFSLPEAMSLLYSLDIVLTE